MHTLGSARLVSTSEGRAHFPDILQTSFGDKAVIGFDRYGRALGALVPIEAVRLLAGDEIDEDIRARIQNGAKSLLNAVDDRAGARSLELLDDAEVAGRRKQRRRPGSKRKHS